MIDVFVSKVSSLSALAVASSFAVFSAITLSDMVVVVSLCLAVVSGGLNIVRHFREKQEHVTRQENTRLENENLRLENEKLKRELGD
jgi:cell shape-determining protein MreC